MALYYLKTNTDKLTYHIIYTKLCNSENDNIFYYQRQFPEERKDNIIDILCSTATFFEEYFTDSILDKIFHSQGLTIDQAYELNIMPEESTQKRQGQVWNNNLSLDEIIEQLTKEESQSKSFTYQKLPNTKHN